MTLLADSEQLIKENDAILGIAKVDHVNSKYEYYLNLTEEEISELNKESCITIQYILTQYAISVSKKINLLNNTLGINKTLFNRELAKVWASYEGLGFMSNDLRVAHATNEYKYLEEMQNEIIKLQGVIDSMGGLVEKVESMIKIFNALAYIKGRY